MSIIDTYTETYGAFYGSYDSEDPTTPATRTRDGWIWYGPDGTRFDLTEFTDGIETLKGISGIYGPGVTIQRSVRPGFAGALTTDVRHEIAEVMLPLYAERMSRWALQQLMESFAESLDPTKGEGQLVHVRLDGSTRTLNCRCVGGLTSAADGSNGPAATRLPVIFQADNPYWLGEVRGQSFTGGSAPSWFNMGSTGAWLPIPLGSSSVLGDVDIENEGSKEAYPVWTVIGPGDSLTITNSDTGEVFGFEGVSLGAGQIIRIDTETKTVRDGNAVNWFSYLSEYALWALQPGTNHVNIALNGATDASYVSVVWQDRFLTA